MIETSENVVNIITEDGPEVILSVTEKEVVILEPLIPGIKGDKGDPGEDGQDGVMGSPDKNYVQTFNVSTSVTVNHNLGKYPNVVIINSANDEVEGDLQYIDLNTVVVYFSAAFSGKIICN